MATRNRAAQPHLPVENVPLPDLPADEASDNPPEAPSPFEALEPVTRDTPADVPDVVVDAVKSVYNRRSIPPAKSLWFPFQLKGKTAADVVVVRKQMAKAAESLNYTIRFDPVKHADQKSDTFKIRVIDKIVKGRAGADGKTDVK